MSVDKDKLSQHDLYYYFIHKHIFPIFYGKKRLFPTDPMF